MNEYIALLRQNRNYRLLWVGNVISLLGDWFNLLASAELLTDLTNTGVAVSYLFMARFLPLFLFSPLGGVLADRYSRRGIMIASDLLRAMTVLGFLLVRLSGQIWLLYLLTVTQFALSAMFTPARSAILANVVDREDLVTANALDSFTWSSMLAMGAFLGGLVATLFGAETAFITDAGTFVISAWMISRISGLIRDPAADTGRRGGWLEFIDGFRYLRREPAILVISLVKGAGSLVWGAMSVLEIAFAEVIFADMHPFLERTFRIEDPGTAMLGIIYVTTGLGTGLGPLLLRRWLGDRPARLKAGISISYALMAIGILGISIAPNFPLFLSVALIRTVGTGTIWVFSAALLQMTVPDRFRGRVFAFEFSVLTLTQSLSTYLAGVAQDEWGMGVRQVALMMSLLGFTVTGFWLLVQFGSAARRRRLDAVETGS